jgi:hypothetical protein
MVHPLFVSLLASCTTCLLVLHFLAAPTFFHPLCCTTILSRILYLVSSCVMFVNSFWFVDDEPFSALWRQTRIISSIYRPKPTKAPLPTFAHLVDKLFNAALTFFAVSSAGAIAFLSTEYYYVGIFMAVFSVVVFLFLGSVDNFNTKWTVCDTNPSGWCAPVVANAFFSALAFALGASTSLVCGFLGECWFCTIMASDLLIVKPRSFLLVSLGCPRGSEVNHLLLQEP